MASRPVLLKRHALVGTLLPPLSYGKESLPHLGIRSFAYLHCLVKYDTLAYIYPSNWENKIRQYCILFDCIPTFALSAGESGFYLIEEKRSFI